MFEVPVHDLRAPRSHPASIALARVAADDLIYMPIAVLRSMTCEMPARHELRNARARAM